MNKREAILMAYKKDKNFNRKKLIKELGCHYTYISNVIRESWKADPSGFSEFLKTDNESSIKESKDQAAKVTESVNEMHIETNGRNIRTAEGSMEYCGVNPDEWTITKKVVNFWDSGKNRNWQVKVWLTKKSKLSSDAVLDRFLKRVPKFKYKSYKPLSIKKGHKSGNLAIIANMDAHIGKLAWDVETGQGDYDLPIAVDDFDYVTDTNLDRCVMFKPEKIIFIIGEDMMHYENLEGVTPVGRNILDTDSRLAKLQDAAIDVCVRNILKCRAVAPVEVILVQGNHDQTSSLWLSKVLRAWFRDDEFVEVDCEPKLRKARLWGTAFIGFSHKVLQSKIPFQQSEFAVQFKDLWAKSEYRECLFGHLHKKGEWKTGNIATSGTMLFRQLTALSKVDYWHYENMFIDAVPGGEALIYNKVTGCVANFTEWTYHRQNNK